LVGADESETDPFLELNSASRVAVFKQVYDAGVPETADLAAARDHFNRAEFGYGISPTQKEAEKMAAAHLGCKLHQAGLVPPPPRHSTP
jgi:hypothetical protein